MTPSGIFGALAGARTAWQQGQRTGEAEQQAAEQQRRDRERQMMQDALLAKLQGVRLEREETELAQLQQQPPVVEAPTPWQPTTREEQIAFARDMAGARQAPAVPKAPRGAGGVGGGMGGERPDKPVQVTEGERKAEALRFIASDAYPVLQQATAPGRFESMMASRGFNEGLSEERQVAEQAAAQLLGAFLYAVSGATVPPEELTKRAREYVPQPGDKPGVVARKRKAAASLMRSMEVMAGRAAGSSGAPMAMAAPAAPPAGGDDDGTGDINLAGAAPDVEALVSQSVLMLQNGTGTIRQAREALPPAVFQRVLAEWARQGAARDRR